MKCQPKNIHKLMKIVNKQFTLITPLKFDYKDLIDDKKNLKDMINEAYGLNGYGAAVIKNIPNFKEMRTRVLNNMFRLYKEPDYVKEKLSKKDVNDPIGWNEDEFYSPDGKKSKKFSSFFARYPNETIIYPKNPKLVEDSTNIWPTTINNFNEDFLSINKYISNALLGLLKQFDNYLVDKIGSNYSLYKDLNNNYVNTNRMIVYEPLEKFNIDVQNWDHWHTDFGILTSVTHPLYFDKNNNPVELPYSSFWVKNRYGKEFECKYDSDELLVQIADSAFVLTAGFIPTTPHSVKANNNCPKDLYRVNLVTFFETNYNYEMKIPTNETFKEIIEKDPLKYYYRHIDSFKNGIDYKEFTDLSLKYLLQSKK